MLTRSQKRKNAGLDDTNSTKTTSRQSDKSVNTQRNGDHKRVNSEDLSVTAKKQQVEEEEEDSSAADQLETKKATEMQHQGGEIARIQSSSSSSATGAATAADQVLLIEVPHNGPTNKLTSSMQTLLQKEVNEAKLANGGNSISKLLRKQRDSRNDQFIDLGEAFHGILDVKRPIYIRDCMFDVVQNIFNYFEAEDWLLFGGTPGCGKSVVGSILALLFAAQGRIVLYQHRGETMLMMSENVTEANLTRFNAMLTRLGACGGSTQVQPGVSTRVWKVASDKTELFIDHFIDLENNVFIKDLGVEQTNVRLVGRGRRGKQLIISSPDHEALQSFHLSVFQQIIILPTWELDEISKLDPKLDARLLRNRFDLIGGNPRWILDKSDLEIEQELDRQITSLTPEVLKKVFKQRSYGGLPSFHSRNELNPSGIDSFLLFKINPISLNVVMSLWKQFDMDFSSDEVMDRMVDKFSAGTEDELLKFFTITQPRGL